MLLRMSKHLLLPRNSHPWADNWLNFHSMCFWASSFSLVISSSAWMLHSLLRLFCRPKHLSLRPWERGHRQTWRGWRSRKVSDPTLYLLSSNGIGDSDLLTVYNAYSAWRRVSNTPGSSEYQFCRKNFLNPQTLANVEDLKNQLIVSMVDAGFLTLDEAEKTSLQRLVLRQRCLAKLTFNSARFPTRQRHFFVLPDSVSVNNDNDLIVNSVIAWSFYPKLLVRDGKGWRNVANNQSVSLHPSSVNKRQSSLKWLSYYHIMQSTNKLVPSSYSIPSYLTHYRFYNAHETGAVEDFAIALLCGDAELKASKQDRCAGRWLTFLRCMLGSWSSMATGFDSL